MAVSVLRRHDSGPATQVSRYVEMCYSLDAELIAAEYRTLVATAPTRFQPYVVDHDISGRASKSTRLEELLAHRMYDEGTELLVPNWRPLRIVDFQMPLKAKQTDKFGKVDLLAAGDGLCVIELKVLRNDGTADTPLNAILEVVGYGAVVQANLNRIKDELRAAGKTVGTGNLHCLVLAPGDYWDRWDHTRVKRPWREALSHAAGVLATATGLLVRYGSFDVAGDIRTLAVADPTV